ncbi:MAG: DNA/RNA nuclease SfsA [Candidatus Thorarchaeota archaeon]
MRENSEVYTSKFIDRPNRFLGRVLLNGNAVEVFIPNPGRMYELMVPGKEVYVRPVSTSHRKTRFNLIAVKHDGVIVSIDSNLPNAFMKQMFRKGQMKEFENFSTIIDEPRVYDGRFDFRLEGDSQVAFIEVKSCTLVERGRAIFPDAPTKRGTRHMLSLARAIKEGLATRAAVFFVIQRPDARIFSPNDPTDSNFGNALRTAQRKGVEVYALSTQVVNWDLSFIGQVPLELDYFSSE